MRKTILIPLLAFFVIHTSCDKTESRSSEYQNSEILKSLDACVNPNPCLYVVGDKNSPDFFDKECDAGTTGSIDWGTDVEVCIRIDTDNTCMFDITNNLSEDITCSLYIPNVGTFGFGVDDNDCYHDDTDDAIDEDATLTVTTASGIDCSASFNINCL